MFSFQHFFSPYWGNSSSGWPNLSFLTVKRWNFQISSSFSISSSQEGEPSSQADANHGRVETWLKQSHGIIHILLNYTWQVPSTWILNVSDQWCGFHGWFGLFFFLFREMMCGKVLCIGLTKESDLMGFHRLETQFLTLRLDLEFSHNTNTNWDFEVL